jgi:hypothetical protein
MRIHILFLMMFFCFTNASAKTIKKNIYTVLEKDVPASKFDEEGFYKRSYDELSIYLDHNKETVYAGGYYCMQGSPLMAGRVIASSSSNTLFSKGESIEIEVKDAVNGCSTGTEYIAVERQGSGVYQVIAEVVATEKALKAGRCVAVVSELYAPLKRNAELAYPLAPKNIPTKQIKDFVTGKVEHVWTGNRACVRFAKGYTAPDAGTILYFYEIKDPDNKKEIDPYVVATGKLIYVHGDYGTVVINASGRIISKGVAVTTRF